MSNQPEVEEDSIDRTDIQTAPSLQETDLEDTAVETLTELNYQESIQNVANIDSQLDNLSEATAYIQRVQSAIKDLKSECGISSLQELDESIESRYIKIGEILIEQVDNEEVLFKTSDEPEKLVTDIENYFDALEDEYERQSALKRDREHLKGCRAELEEHPGTDVNEAIKIYKDQQEKLETAHHFLQLKDGECSRCGVKWENISKNRRREIEQKLEELEEEFEPDGGKFDENFARETKASVDSKLDDLEELQEEIRGLEDKIDRHEQQDTDTLDRLSTTYVED